MVSPKAGFTSVGSRRLYGRPKWSNACGSKMDMSIGASDDNRLVFGNRRAQLVITRASVEIPGLGGWFVDWRISHYPHYDQVFSAGRRHFTKDDLIRAFALRDFDQAASQTLLTETDRAILCVFRGDFARTGKFIVWHNFLNIPAPGTGFNGDPNISIHVSPAIRNAVGTFLQ